MSRMVEVKLVNGNRVLLPNDFRRVYNLVEKTTTCITWTAKFPFLKFEKHTYVKFKFESCHSVSKNIYDPVYKVDCMALQLASLFDVNAKPFEFSVITYDLQS